MSKPKPDPVYVRASVWRSCNLRCTYCPIEEGMENRVPDHLAGQRLSTDSYIRNLRSIAAAGVRGVSFTGGEPTLRLDLDRIIEEVRPHFDRVELTTNGARLDRVKDVVRQHIDLMKVSLDTVRESDLRLITGRSYTMDHARVAIEWALGEGVPVGINVVLMRRTLDDLRDTIGFARSMVSGVPDSRLHLSLLDFYYTPSRRQEWLADFVPTSQVLDLLRKWYGDPAVQERFGCTFYWFDADGFDIRVKDSFGATMRAPKCQGCSSYCQEGIYGIKHSVEGWITTCPSNRDDLGVHLPQEADPAEIDRLLRNVLSDVEAATPDARSFATLRATHHLGLPLYDISRSKV
ncbi:radical SAM protein [Nocardia sp. BMG51109]|uniref:radical SAM protein n=1 Tax=Nocardia sp. BMG51109 TaxID=1056816 RepID=UPI000A04F1BA|nr:radical SAM protein [Nocardia sp. BMG51109]